MKNLKNFTFLTLILLLAYSCEKDELTSNVPTFDIDLFETNLRNNINWGNNSPIGWAYTISSNGNLAKSAAFGLARLPADNNSMNFTVNKKINVASITKFYTAIAAMQLIYANNLTINSNIEPWLPDSWTRGPGVNSLTFRDLLTHTSGLQSVNTDFNNTLSYEGLQACIETGVVNPKTRNYLNVNFALFRVLIPSLWSALPDPPTINIENDNNTQFMYLLYMQQNIFDPLDLPLVGCTPEAREISTLYYNVGDAQNGSNGAYYFSWNPISGGGGYFLTAMEMAKVNAYFEHTEVLLPNNLKEIMKSNRIGFGVAHNLETRGNYYSHAGSISNTSNQGVQGLIAIFPNGVDCIVIMNTQGVTFNDPQGNNSLRAAIYKAYNDAWSN
jgi:D-alanyl-D-alanine carboxypeptidase